MNFRNVLFVLLLLLPLSLHAQFEIEPEETEEPEGRWYLSPDFGLILGDITMVEVAPTIGFHLTPQLSTGIGVRYEYFRQLNFYTRAVEVNTSKLGLRAFVKIVLIPDLSDALPIPSKLSLFTYAEYEALNLDKEYYGLLQTIDSERFWHHGFLAGGGISQQVSKRVFMNIMILSDLTNSSSSPYNNPLIRFGLQIYFN